MATKHKSENIYAACRDGDHVYARDWVLSVENDVNQGYNYNSLIGHGGFLFLPCACIRIYLQIYLYCICVF